jgi:hypothetical protein
MTDNEKLQLIAKIIGNAYECMPSDGLDMYYEATIESIRVITEFRGDGENE